MRESERKRKPKRKARTSTGMKVLIGIGTAFGLFIGSGCLLALFSRSNIPIDPKLAERRQKDREEFAGRLTPKGWEWRREHDVAITMLVPARLDIKTSKSWQGGRLLPGLVYSGRSDGIYMEFVTYTALSKPSGEKSLLDELAITQNAGVTLIADRQLPGKRAGRELRIRDDRGEAVLRAYQYSDDLVFLVSLSGNIQGPVFQQVIDSISPDETDDTKVNSKDGPQPSESNGTEESQEQPTQ